MKIAVAGAGAFGTALALSLSEKHEALTLVARDTAAKREIEAHNASPKLPHVPLPANIRIETPQTGLADAEIILLAIPAQTIGGFLEAHHDALQGKSLVACAKGIDISTLLGPGELISQSVPSAAAMVLTGPSFADDIAIGLPTALTLAVNPSDLEAGEAAQAALSTPCLRLYLSSDMRGAQLGGAIKNVIAIACGACMGAGYGESAKAALMTRGFSEMVRLAPIVGADPETLTGLSGLGDLSLTCNSDLSRNYRFGFALGKGEPFDPSITVEGAKTAIAVETLAAKNGLELPICSVVAALSSGKITVGDAMQFLLSRPLTTEH